MKIFLSHASEDKSAAESIAFSLRSRGHKVFLDRDDLPPGQSYDQQIERAVKESDILIFLVSPSSVTSGRYTLTELAFARRKWQNPNGRILPVIARKTPFDEIPSYLKAVTLLEPLGNITAETCAAVRFSFHLCSPTREDTICANSVPGVVLGGLWQDHRQYCCQTTKNSYLDPA